MSKNNNIIDINGKRYDAKTGKLLTASVSEAKVTKPAQNMTSSINKPSMHDVVRQPAKSASAHKPIPSKTLMRHAVKKPSKPAKKTIKAQGPSYALDKAPLGDVVVSKSVKSLDHKKLQHAAKIPKSGLITHFSAITSDANLQADSTPLPQTKPIPQTPPPAKTKPQTTSELLEHAIRQANSHEQPPADKPHSRHKRRVRASIASAMAVMLLAFVGYQEIPNLRLNLASAKAGFNASMPSYKPAGYGLGQLSYSPGVVATKFTSNSDERSYTLTQKTSAWNSQALRDNFVTNTSHSYQTVETGGRTIFIYGNGSATWVNGGVWYIIQSDGSLTSHQLVELAKSI